MNSKRMHSSALININNSIGRGSAAVDLNTIPSAAIGTVEVLREGAAAQYGSDAIAGVINLRLREAREGGGASVTYGQHLTTVETRHNERDETDGATTTVSGWAGLPLGPEGFLTVTGEYLARDPTSRGDQDLRIAGNVNNSPTGSIVTSRFGDPEVTQYTAFVNAGLPISESWELYGYGGYQKRDASSAANPRLPINASGNITNNFNNGANQTQNVTSNVLAVTPKGFLPLIEPEVQDINAALGLRGEMGGWDADFSVTYGKNEIQYRTVNSLNASIATAQVTPGIANNPYFGQTPQRDFDSGKLEYAQTVVNFDLKRGFGIVTLATGLEYRSEEFAETAGEYSSYGVALSTTGARLVLPGGPQGGSQGFNGLQALDATSVDRNSHAAYIEADAQITDKLQAGLAVRYEDYSDFGETLNGKVSARYDFADYFALRGAVSSGFRAPGLQQTSFTATSTNFIAGVPTDILTTRASGALGAQFGAKPLDPETASNYSVGTVIRAGNFVATIDAYQIDIADRIVLSDNLLGAATGTPTQVAIFNLIAPFSSQATGVRFFINGVDTTTKGIDAVLTYKIPTDTVGTFTVTATGNVNETEVTRTPTTTQLSALPVPPILFPQNRVLEFEKGTPGYKASLVVDWTGGIWSATLRGTQYGSVLTPQAPPNLNATWRSAPAFVLDAEARAKFDRFGFAVGANNLLDEYPTQSPDVVNGINLYSNGATAFSNYSPFAPSGRYVYGKVSVSW
jgi:iron complex outermembrane receptor protein